MVFQVRTSYLPEEISWAERLSPLLTYVRDNGRYEIDYTQFHGTKPVTMPDCSACQWSESKHLYKVKDRMLSTKQWITDDEDEPDDYSVSFTVQLPDRLTSRSSSGPVWNLFGKNRHSKDSYINTISSTPDNSYSSVITLSHSKQKESANWSVKDDVVVDFSAGGQSTQL
jgi:hypothetical protein